MGSSKMEVSKPDLSLDYPMMKVIRIEPTDIYCISIISKPIHWKKFLTQVVSAELHQNHRRGFNSKAQKKYKFDPSLV